MAAPANKRPWLIPFLPCQVEFEEKNPWGNVAFRGKCQEYVDYLQKIQSAKERGIPSEKGPYSGVMCQEFWGAKKCYTFEGTQAVELLTLLKKASWSSS